MARIRESDLLLPALYVIGQNNGANTTRIKNTLIDVFRPTGEDNELLAGRNDTKFTQIVRNLLGSHYTTNGMSDYTVKNAGRFTLTEAGEALVSEHTEVLQSLFSKAFDYDRTTELASKVYTAHGSRRTLQMYTEEDVVLEGQASVVQARVRERSRLLRQAAIEHYTVEGRIQCAVCGFDFYETYGQLGEGYIQMHHEKPICQYADEGFAQHVREAVRDMKPVCPNCHCMLHRQRGTPLTVAQLRTILEDVQNART